MLMVGTGADGGADGGAPQRNSTKIEPAELSNLASSLMLASLAVPLLAKKNDGIAMLDNDSDRERSLRMAGLLGFSKNPKREWLLSEVTAKNVGAQVEPRAPSKSADASGAWNRTIDRVS